MTTQKQNQLAAIRPRLAFARSKTGDNTCNSLLAKRRAKLIPPAKLKVIK